MDPFDSEFQKHLENIKKEKLTAEQRIELTCSYVPGTTLRMNKVKIPLIGFRVYDTPGIFSEHQNYALIDELKTLKAFNFSKAVKPPRIHVGARHRSQECEAELARRL